MSDPQSYIIVENDDGTFTAYVNFGMYQSKEEAEHNLDLAMRMLGMQLTKSPTVH
jgi:hypothetical protein|tara:strand:+ start:215 stop:379 length:165 start_codon:yes stop_codon:yes gene_type:complete